MTCASLQQIIRSHSPGGIHSTRTGKSCIMRCVPTFSSCISQIHSLGVTLHWFMLTLDSSLYDRTPTCIQDNIRLLEPRTIQHWLRYERRKYDGASSTLLNWKKNSSPVSNNLCHFYSTANKQICYVNTQLLKKHHLYNSVWHIVAVRKWYTMKKWIRLHVYKPC